MPVEIVKKAAMAEDLFIYARNSVEMVEAQKKTIEGFKAKIVVETARRDELADNLAIARKNKWRSETLKRHVQYANNRIEFYTKIVEALEAGFQIIPEMDVDVFAIRTTRDPAKNQVTGESKWGGPTPGDQTTNSPPVGDGEYVAPQAKIEEDHWHKEPKKEGDEKVLMVTRKAIEHDEVEFPFQLAKPQILEMTAAAMQKKIFDELGVLPARRAKTDPIVVGRITLKGSGARWQRRSVNFMVAWFIDLKDM